MVTGQTAGNVPIAQKNTQQFVEDALIACLASFTGSDFKK